VLKSSELLLYIVFICVLFEFESRIVAEAGSLGDLICLFCLLSMAISLFGFGEYPW
jgi:hypothetical protein